MVDQRPVLTDSFGRQIDYLRVSITDRCDMRCSYCLPVGFKDFEEPASWLTVDELTRLVSLFVRLGVSKVRMTGGEPLLRRGVEDIARQFARLAGVSDLSMSTNGSRLQRHAEELRRAGVRRLNISLDTLDANKFTDITQRDVLQQVLEGIETACQVGFESIKLNCVVQAGLNDDGIDDLIVYAKRRNLVLRLIEAMPVGYTGRQTSTVNLAAKSTLLAREHGLVPHLDSGSHGPARYWRSTDGAFTLGLITPMSQHFCATCNRVRLTVDGQLLLCLGQNDAVPLGRYLRDGMSDDELIEVIRSAIARKPERHEFIEQPDKIVRFMSATGG